MKSMGLFGKNSKLKALEEKKEITAEANSKAPLMPYRRLKLNQLVIDSLQDLSLGPIQINTPPIKYRKLNVSQKVKNLLIEQAFGPIPPKAPRMLSRRLVSGIFFVERKKVERVRSFLSSISSNCPSLSASSPVVMRQ